MNRFAAILIAILVLAPAHSTALEMTPRLDPDYLTLPWFGIDRPSNTFCRIILNKDGTGKIGIAHCQVMKERCDDWQVYEINKWEYAKYQIIVHQQTGISQKHPLRFVINQVFSNLEVHIYDGSQVVGPITMLSEPTVLEASRVLKTEMKP